MKKLIFCLAICVLIARTAFAETNAKKNVFNEMVDETVSSIKGILAPSMRLAPIVVTPSRYEESSIDVAKNVTVIDQEQISRSYARYVPELLESAAGVNVRSTLGNGKATEVDIRGFGEAAPSNVLVLVNGRRTNQIDLSGADWTQIDIGSIEKIEIVRGSQSVLYGDNATGGVINIITKTGTGKKPRIGLESAWGSYHYGLYGGYIEGGDNFLDYYSRLSYSTTRGYRTNNGLVLTDFNYNTTLKPTEYFHLKFEGNYHKDWYGLPGALKPANIDAVGWQGSIYPNNKAKTTDYYFMATPEIEYSGDLGDITVSGDAILRNRRVESVFFSPFGVTENDDHINTFGFTPKVTAKNEFLGIENKVIAGLDYYNSENSISSTNPPGVDKIIITKDTTGLYIEDSASLTPSLILNGGYRGEWANYKFDQEQVLFAINKKQEFEWAGDTGINYKYNDRSSVYATYSHSYRYPTTEEWYATIVDYGAGPTGGLNLNLTPQEGNNYEIGIKENSFKFLAVKAACYIMDLKHELYYDPNTISSNSNSIYDRTMHQGLELEGHLYMIDNLDIFTNYTYQKAFFAGGRYGGNEIPMVPNQKISSGFDYKFMDCIDVNYLINFVGPRRFISDQANVVPSMKSFITHDVKFSYYKYDFEVYGAIYNIFNERYAEQGVLGYNSTFTSRTDPGYYPSPGTNFVVGTKYKF